MFQSDLDLPFDDAAVACCSEDVAAARLVSGWQPRVVLQTLGGLVDPDDASAAATLSYAFDWLRLGHLIILAHERCAADPLPTAERLRALLATPRLGRLRRQGVTLHPIALPARAEADRARRGESADVRGGPGSLKQR